MYCYRLGRLLVGLEWTSEHTLPVTWHMVHSIFSPIYETFPVITYLDPNLNFNELFKFACCTLTPLYTGHTWDQKDGRMIRIYMYIYIIICIYSYGKRQQQFVKFVRRFFDKNRHQSAALLVGEKWHECRHVFKCHCGALLHSFWRCTVNRQGVTDLTINVRFTCNYVYSTHTLGSQPQLTSW